jgi:hypothetical protein
MECNANVRCKIQGKSAAHNGTDQSSWWSEKLKSDTQQFDEPSKRN